MTASNAGHHGVFRLCGSPSIRYVVTRGHTEKDSTCDAQRGALNARGAARTHQ
jgi:hypothetical protein